MYLERFRAHPLCSGYFKQMFGHVGNPGGAARTCYPALERARAATIPDSRGLLAARVVGTRLERHSLPGALLALNLVVKVCYDHLTGREVRGPRNRDIAESRCI